jgi:hypothetical protein
MEKTKKQSVLFHQWHDKKLEKETFDYKESKDDPEISEVSKESILEAWRSSSIVVEGRNNFEFLSEENWLNNFDKLSEYY